MLLSVFSKVSDKANIHANDLLQGLLDRLVILGEKIIIAALVYFIGNWLIKFIRRSIKKLLSRKKIDPTVASFVYSFINAVLKAVLIISIVTILGLPATSLAAILAAAGLAVGMAMKDNLSNFAGGVMLLMNKPFRLGDRVVAQGQDGIVKEIGILYTVLLTGDARTVFLPNGPLSTGSIINYSTNRHRRIDISFNINYGTDIDVLKQSIQEVIDKNIKIQKDPAPFIGVTSVNNGNFDITMRVWVLNSDYGSVSIDLNESIYRVLSDRGIYTSAVLTVKMDNN